MTGFKKVQVRPGIHAIVAEGMDEEAERAVVRHIRKALDQQQAGKTDDNGEPPVVQSDQ